MKKNGFTLAEVLITLAIIGVVATLTLPTLMSNANDRQYVAGFKKAVNTLSSAARINQVESGYDFSSIASDDVENFDPNEYASIFAMLNARANVDAHRTGRVGSGSFISHQGATTSALKNGQFVISFNDGTSLIYTPSELDDEGEVKTDDDDKTIPSSNLLAIIDVNGVKGPNIVSNCDNAKLGVELKEDADKLTTETAGEVLKVEDKCTVDNRVIKDQFMVRLQGTQVIPVGAAAIWAMAQ